MGQNKSEDVQVRTAEPLDWNALWSLEDRAVLLAHLMRVEHETAGYVRDGIFVKVYDEDGKLLLAVHPDFLVNSEGERLVNFSTKQGVAKRPAPGLDQQPSTL